MYSWMIKFRVGDRAGFVHQVSIGIGQSCTNEKRRLWIINAVIFYVKANG